MRPSLPSAAAAAAIALFSNQAAAQQRPASDPLRISVGVPEIKPNKLSGAGYVCEFSNVSSDVLHIVMPIPDIRQPAEKLGDGAIMAVDATRDVVFAWMDLTKSRRQPQIGTADKDGSTVTGIWDAHHYEPKEPAFGMARLNEVVSAYVPFREACAKKFLRQLPRLQKAPPLPPVAQNLGPAS